jgi:predicted ATPase/DNA-binding CsgD family transcriptional regulator
MNSHPKPDTLDPLTERELEILRLIAEGLSNAEIAQRLVLSLGTVKWYNTQIFDKLGVKNRTQAIARTRELGLLASEDSPFSPPPRSDKPRHNLPVHPMPLIGREDELDTISKLMTGDDCRLLTLVGPGGMGKTHLAVEAAGRLLPSFADGVYFVPLASLTSPDDILPTIADALDFHFGEGKDPLRQLIGHIRDRRMLLLLDNFDSLTEGAGLVAEILSGAPGVKLIATSRERLNLQEEMVLRVGGVKLPDMESAAGALESDAVRLFIGRTRQAQPDFVPGTHDLASIMRICQMVEGMPLGIVLAAAWMEILPPEEIAAEIARSLDFLQTEMRNLPERHRSIRGVFESAWHRLSENERAVFAKLSVFRGGFTREAAQTVADASLPTLMALVNKSLLRRDADGRYSIHELLRQYTAEQLEQLQGADAANAAHSQHYLEVLSARKTGDASLDQVEADIDNLRLAWNWAVEHRQYKLIDSALQNLHEFCIRHSRYWDALKFFNQAIERAEEHPGSVDARTILRLRECRGKVRVLLGMEEFEGAVADLTYVRDAAHEMGDFAWERQLLVHIGQIYRKTERSDEAVHYLNEVIRFSKANHNLRAVADALYHLGTVHWDEGDNTNRGAFYREAIKICRQLGIHDIVAVQAHHGMGESFLMGGQPEEAMASFTESLELARQVGDHSYESENLQMIGWSLVGAIGIGDYPRAIEFFRHSLAISLDDHLHWHTMCSLIGSGLAQGSLGDYENGLVNVQRGEQMAQSVGLARFRSMAVDVLGQHFQDLNLLDKAQALHDLGVNLMLKAESTFWLPRLQANRAIDRLRQGDLNVGAELTEALGIALSRGQEFHVIRCLEGLAELHVARHEPQQAVHYANELMKLAEERNMREMKAAAHHWRGEALMLSGKLDEAQSELRTAAEIADQVGRLRLIWDVQAALARCAHLRGDTERANQHEASVREIVGRIAANLSSDDLRLGLPEAFPTP